MKRLVSSDEFRISNSKVGFEVDFKVYIRIRLNLTVEFDQKLAKCFVVVKLNLLPIKA